VTTAAQPNITSVGTLSALSVTGNVNGGNLRTTGSVSATGTITGATIQGNGSQLTGVVTSIIAGTGISVNAATGVVTIATTGSGGNSISNGTSSVAIPTTNGDINFTTGANVNIGANLQVSGQYTSVNSIIIGGGTPASSSASGIQGQILWSSTYLYVCVSSNSWRRVALSAF
jgi:hypothetical protein